jgi:hypothetical protein
MPHRIGLVAALVVGLGALALFAPGPAAALKTEVVTEVGHTFAVDGEPNNGGVSLGLSFLWPIEDRIRVGVMGVGDELGEATTRLLGPNGEDLGPAAAGARYTWGGAVRLEAHPLTAHRVNPFALLTWGIYRVQEDLRGTTIDTDYAAGLGLGGGALHSFNAQHAVGLMLRGQWLSHGSSQGYLSAALIWRWRWEGAPVPTPAGTTTTSK